MKIETIDLYFRGVPQAIATFVVRGKNGVALIETGPTSTLPACLEGLARLGLRPSDIRHVLLTHIHFDHAGAAGWWAEQGAQIYVHELGASHIIDPTRLIDSARKIYGEKMDALWGEIRAVPESQLTPLQDNDLIEIGDLRFTAWNTPGHAFHHHAFVIENVAFTGDVAGVRLPDHSFISVASAPPQFDPIAYDRSLQRLIEGAFDQLYLTHFGVVDEVQAHLARYKRLVQGSSELIDAHLLNGADAEAIRRHFIVYNEERRMREHLSDEMWQRYETANPLEMSADGIALYWIKQFRKQTGFGTIELS